MQTVLCMKIEELMELSIHYNTPLSSSAAVERLFSIGKDILKPKCSGCGFSANHFEMLALLEGNKLILLQRLSYQNRTFVWFHNTKMNDFDLNTHHGALHVKS